MIAFGPLSYLADDAASSSAVIGLLMSIPGMKYEPGSVRLLCSVETTAESFGVAFNPISPIGVTMCETAPHINITTPPAIAAIIIRILDFLLRSRLHLPTQDRHRNQKEQEEKVVPDRDVIPRHR